MTCNTRAHSSCFFFDKGLYYLKGLSIKFDLYVTKMHTLARIW
jgi:hypothetical protein